MSAVTLEFYMALVLRCGLLLCIGSSGRVTDKVVVFVRFGNVAQTGLLRFSFVFVFLLHSRHLVVCLEKREVTVCVRSSSLP